MSKDWKLLEFEFAALSLKRSKDTGSTFDRTKLLDEFNFLALPGSLDLSPQKANNPPAKSSFTCIRWYAAKGSVKFSF